MFDWLKNHPCFVLFICTAIFIMFLIVSDFRTSYKFENAIECYWSLYQKAPTLEAKAIYIDKLVLALQNSKHHDYDAIWFKTLDNSWDKNMELMLLLQKRLHEIQTMDVRSFEYQQAMMQINEMNSSKMFGVLQGCWFYEHYFFMWNWIAVVEVLGIFLCLFFLLLRSFSNHV